MKFSVNTNLGRNKVGGYVVGIGRYDDDDDIYDFDLSKYNLSYIGAYKLGDNELILDESKKQEIDNAKAQEEKLIRVAELKQMLQDTDYIACKIAEGSATREEYATIITQRESWRNEINELES